MGCLFTLRLLDRSPRIKYFGMTLFYLYSRMNQFYQLFIILIYEQFDVIYYVFEIKINKIITIAQQIIEFLCPI